jgi:hypothetical protein
MMSTETPPHEEAKPAKPLPATVPTRRYVVAWVVMTVSLLGYWCCRPLLWPTVFRWGQIVVLMASWKVATLLILSPAGWARLTRLRLLAYCIWPGMQPQLFFRGREPAAGMPIPTVKGLLLNLLTAVLLLYGVPWLLPTTTPLWARFWVGLLGLCFLFLFRFDLASLIFRAIGFPVDKLWWCPVAATTVGVFWGQRWNRVVSGMVRDVIFLPLSRRASPQIALFVVFLYSGIYHEFVSFWAGSGYGGPTLYFLVQFVGVVIETVRPFRRALQRRPWLGRLWTLSVVLLPVGLFLHRDLIDRVLLPMLADLRVPGLSQ